MITLGKKEERLLRKATLPFFLVMLAISGPFVAAIEFNIIDAKTWQPGPILYAVLMVGNVAALGWSACVLLVQFCGLDAWRNVAEYRAQTQVGMPPHVMVDRHDPEHPATVQWTDEYPSAITVGQRFDAFATLFLLLIGGGCGYLGYYLFGAWLGWVGAVILGVWGLGVAWAIVQAVRSIFGGFYWGNRFIESPISYFQADCVARITSDRHGALLFVVTRRDHLRDRPVPEPHPERVEIPWDDRFQRSGFEIADYETYFGDRMRRRPPSKVIVFGTAGEAVLISQWGPQRGRQAHADWLGKLRGVLQAEFMGEKQLRYLKKYEASKRAAAAAKAVSSSGDDTIPSHL